MTGRPEGDFRLYELDPGLLRVDYVANAEVGEPEARDVLEKITLLGRARPLLVDIRPLRRVSLGARKVLATQTAATRVALFVDSPLSRTLASFFLTVSQPDRPMRMFTDETEALVWLRNG